MCASSLKAVRRPGAHQNGMERSWPCAQTVRNSPSRHPYPQLKPGERCCSPRFCATSQSGSVRRMHCARVKNDFKRWRTICPSWSGWPMRTVGFSGTTNVGWITRARQSKRCRAGDGKRCTIPITSIAWWQASSIRGIRDSRGRTLFRCEAGTALIAGFSLAPCRSEMQTKEWFVGSGPTPT